MNRSFDSCDLSVHSYPGQGSTRIRTGDSVHLIKTYFSLKLPSFSVLPSYESTKIRCKMRLWTNNIVALLFMGAAAATDILFDHFEVHPKFVVAQILNTISATTVIVKEMVSVTSMAYITHATLLGMLFLAVVQRI
ncbi:hypothetical protein BO79DRAFT_212706 [Aspergillus costaricaensis CBS 115574]|uniref:Uncharacterized protein n=1 Tax=Aspergillus costaricaensis CBS 115574 TaxID=1448317 RepID=A0ACD1IWE6_9EURO|nr:hypothetical protein BO79DRAFT_212706 [Aspergillus costaricaensis CBS 115574]RAK94468.1 hypothetical protein BO79DRAFT_212706 [Aspergillus costaricaensis CBS 115574]